jgi:hypothetical protein
MEEIAQFNRADLKTLTLFENGKPLQIPPEAFDTFRFTGLSNKEFVGLEFWRHFDES